MRFVDWLTEVVLEQERSIVVPKYLSTAIIFNEPRYAASVSLEHAAWLLRELEEFSGEWRKGLAYFEKYEVWITRRNYQRLIKILENRVSLKKAA